MRILVILASASVLLTSCHESEPTVEVTDTRRLTFHDKSPSGNVVDLPPVGWRNIPPTRFRDVNFLAGPEEEVEIYISNASGDPLQNANRWLGQFGLTPVTDPRSFATIDIIGRPATLVEADGTFNSGMGGEAKENYALVGVIRPIAGGLLTVKMVGPTEAVQALRPEFVTYCETLKTSESIKIEKIEPETPES